MPSLILGSRSLAAWSGRTLVLGVTGSEPTATAGADLPKSSAELQAVVAAAVREVGGPDVSDDDARRAREPSWDRDPSEGAES